MFTSNILWISIATIVDWPIVFWHAVQSIAQYCVFNAGQFEESASIKKVNLSTLWIEFAEFRRTNYKQELVELSLKRESVNKNMKHLLDFARVSNVVHRLVVFV